jgi:hypothetical protein
MLPPEQRGRAWAAKHGKRPYADEEYGHRVWFNAASIAVKGMENTDPASDLPEGLFTRIDAGQAVNPEEYADNKNSQLHFATEGAAYRALGRALEGEMLDEILAEEGPQ